MMKCPCCDSEVEPQWLIDGRWLIAPDGERFKAEKGSMKLMRKLLHGPVRKSENKFGPDGYQLMSVYVTTLNKMFHEYGLPFIIRYDRHARNFHLREVGTYEQNNDVTKRAQDVHSGPRYDDLRR